MIAIACPICISAGLAAIVAAAVSWITVRKNCDPHCGECDPHCPERETDD